MVANHDDLDSEKKVQPYIRSRHSKDLLVSVFRFPENPFPIKTETQLLAGYKAIGIVTSLVISVGSGQLPSLKLT